MRHELVGDTVAAPTGTPGAVAWVDVRTVSSARWGRPGSASTMACVLRTVGRAVRTDDRICPVGTSLVAVAFGPSAAGVPLRVLGDRLARTVGPGPHVDRSDTGLSTAVGVAGPLEGPDGCAPGGVARRALAAARTSRSLLERAADRTPPAAAVTTDHRVTGHLSPAGSVPAVVPVHQRTTVRYLATCVDGVPTMRPTERTTPAGEAQGGPPVGHRCVLVVDPMAGADGIPGFAAAATASLLARLGCRTIATGASPDGPPVLTVDGLDADLVVLVLDGAWVGHGPGWTGGAWDLPARLTNAYVDKGVPVLALGAGAGAGAVAACVDEGALALIDPDRLAEALRSLERLSADEARQVAELEFPERFRALLALTACERRVLYYLTRGWTAQDIADELVVSLTTVRSHIRSVLRKLGVRSQLAAVAVATSRDLAHHDLSDAG